MKRPMNINGIEYVNVPGTDYWYSSECFGTYPCNHYFIQMVPGAAVRLDDSSVNFAIRLQNNDCVVPEHFHGYLSSDWDKPLRDLHEQLQK